MPGLATSITLISKHAMRFIMCLSSAGPLGLSPAASGVRTNRLSPYRQEQSFDQHGTCDRVCCGNRLGNKGS